MKKIHRIVVACIAVLGLIKSSAGAIDLSGTWEGTKKCKGVIGGLKYPLQKGSSTLQIIQSGGDLDVLMDANTAAEMSFHGAVSQDPNDLEKAAIALAGSGTSSMFSTLTGTNAMGTGQAVAKSKRGTGKLTAVVMQTVGSAGNLTSVHTCKVNYKRSP